MLSMRSKYLISIHSFGFILAAAAVAQSTPDASREIVTVGAYGGFAADIFNAAFSVDDAGRITDAGACGRFERGTGQAPVFGLTAEMPVATALRARLLAEYHARSGTLRFPCVDPASIRLPDGSVTDALTDHVADVSYTSIIGRVALSYRPFAAPVEFSAGPTLSLVLPTPRFDAREEVVAPAAAEFLGGGQVRHYGSGDLAIGAHVSFGIGAGVAYRAPIGERLTLMPEVSGLLALTDDVPAARLRAHTVQGTIGLLYRFDRTAAPALAAGPAPELPTPKRPGGPNLDITLVAQAKDPDGNPTDTLIVQQSGVVDSRLHPLLTYLFFDEGASDIPARYIRRAGADAGAFSEERLRKLGTLDIYYNLLDIIGMRMRRHPEATITLTGTQPDAVAGDKPTLAQKRADNVREYLVNVWKIAPDRIAVQSRVEPLMRSNPETRDGAAENRRVEITSSTYAIVEPVLLADTTADCVVPPTWLAPRVSTEAGLERWEITISGGVKHDAIYSGSGTPPGHLELPHEFINAAAGTRPAQFGMKLTVRDRAGQEVSDSTSLPLKWVNNLSDVRFGSGSYSLILFDFNSAQLRPEHLRTIDLVNTRSDTSAHADVIGYTDMLGSDELNQTLSEQRAQSVSGHLKAKVDQVIGRGETTRLYDNALPEGRFYSRTVTIETSTP